MHLRLPKIQDANLEGKSVIIRFDGDVPMRITQGGGRKIEDANRLEASLPTIRYCLDHGAKVILITHMGRPSYPVPELSLSTEILVPFFEKALGEPVGFCDDHYFPGFGGKRFPGQRIVLLENLRFDPGEEKNSPGFARRLADVADIYCNDAFAVSHRPHASFVGLPQLLPHYAGERLIQEITTLSPLLGDVDRPYCVVLGGAKASDKSPIIADLIDRVDSFLIGGLVGVTYLAAQGFAVGAHKVEKDEIRFAQKCIRRMHEKHRLCILPSDIMTQNREVKRLQDWGKDDLMLDIGTATQKQFAQAIERANTVFWNGAMGKFEDSAFAAGTVAVARSIGHSHAETKVASGGDTVSAIHHFKLEKGFTFISTGGGATLEYIAGRRLPGLATLES